MTSTDVFFRLLNMILAVAIVAFVLRLLGFHL